MHLRQIDLWFRFRGTDIARDIQVEIVLFDLLHAHPPGIALYFLWALLIGVDDLVDVFGQQFVLAFAFLEMLAGVDEQHVIGLLAFFQHQNAHRDAGGKKQVGGQADDGVDIAVGEQLLADLRLCPAAKQHAVGQDGGNQIASIALRAITSFNPLPPDSGGR